MVGGTAPGMVVWMPSRPAGACAPIRSVTMAPQSPPWATRWRYPRRSISTAEVLVVVGPDLANPPAGTTTSTREPNLIRPTRCPRCTVSPSL